MSDRTEHNVPERDEPRRGRWTGPGAGKDEPGLSWEGEGTVRRDRAPAAPRSLLWRAAAVVAAGALLAALGLALAGGTAGPGEGSDEQVRRVVVQLHVHR